MEMGSVRQGGNKSWHVLPGPSQVEIKQAGVSGWVKGLFGGGKAGEAAVTFVPGGAIRFQISWVWVGETAHPELEVLG